MSIKFAPNDWDRIKENYTKWWNGELDRPLIPIRLRGEEPHRPMPNVPLLSQQNCTDLSVSAKDIIDRLDYELSCYEYLGDAYPRVNLDSFGPGIIAAFLGANLDNTTGNVWFHPKKVIPIDELHFEYDPDNIWLNRIKDICYEGMKRWEGQVLMAMPDLGSPLDTLAVFRTTENLLFDLYDDPEEVKRLVKELHELWWKYYNEINSILQPVNPGYSDWAGIYSDKPSYVVQCDFSYMIGPDFFDEFVKPELETTCKMLDRSLYHMDGIGELNHLDSLLTIKELDAVQWVPGTGQPEQYEWPDVMKKIHRAGKKMQVNSGLDNFNKVSSVIGTTKGLHLQDVVGTTDQKEEFLKVLKNHGVI